MPVSITKPTTTYVLIHEFSPYVFNGYRKVKFSANLNGVDKEFEARVPSKVFFNGKENITDRNETDLSKVVLFKATLETIDNHWHFTSLIRIKDDLEFIPKPRVSILSTAINALGKAGK